MCTSLSSITFTCTCNISLPRRRYKFWYAPLNRIAITFRNPTLRFSSALNDRSFGISWFSPEVEGDDDSGGWAILESPVPNQQTGLPKVLVLTIGTSALLLAAFFHFSLPRKGSKLLSGNLLHDIFPSKVAEHGVAEPDEPHGESVVSEFDNVDLSDSPSDAAAKLANTRPRSVPIAVDSSQEEALSVLKKLKIIENDVKAGELCSRREYARWLVRSSSLLERNVKHKIVPAYTLSGSMITAFDDVAFGDPDFETIQALAEAGIVPSKLSGEYSFIDQRDISFYPERFISRRDLIDWRGQVEYDYAYVGNLEMSKMKSYLLDTKEISLETLPGLSMDLLAGERSLHRKVFGKVRRLQPNKPATKAQAAVILTSGRMAEEIRTELSRIETEESSRQDAKEEIKHEFLNRAEIQKFWHEKAEDEKIHTMKANQVLLEALDELGKGKIHHQKEYEECLKKKAALDCQRQLLNGLQLEVNEMTERLGIERDDLIAEKETLRLVSSELQCKKEGMLDAKSWLEAEIEALRILRSWIQDEARKTQARANVLEEVGRRWRWNGHE